MEDGDITTIDNMHRYGGGFAKALARAAMAADSVNYMRLKAAFPDAWAKYGIEWPRLVRVEVLRDPSVREYECWRVSFGGDLTSPCFNAKGPAAVYAEQLRRGDQKPAFSSDNADDE